MVPEKNLYRSRIPINIARSLTPYNRLLCRLANCVPIHISMSTNHACDRYLHITSSSRFPDFPSVDMAKCVGIETGYIKMRGDNKYASKWVGIACGLRWDEKIIYILCGAGVGLPTQGFVEWGGSSPHNPHARFSQWGLCGADLRG